MLFSAYKSPADMIPSLNTIHGGVMRFGGCVSLMCVAIYFKQWMAVSVCGAVALSYAIGMNGYLFRRCHWYRHWVGWVVAVNVAALFLMYLTGSVWWTVLPLLYEVFSKSLYEDELTKFGREHNIPREILQDNPSEQ